MVYLLRKNIRTKRPSNKLDYIKLGPFRIKEKVGTINYRLQLPKETRLHLVFHILLLEPVDPGTPVVRTIRIEEDLEYEVETILDQQKIDG